MLIRGHLKITAYSDQHSAVDFNSATQVVQWCSFKTRLWCFPYAHAIACQSMFLQLPSP